MATRQAFRGNDEEIGLREHVRETVQSGDVYLLPVRVPDLAKTTYGSLSSDFKPPAAKRADVRILPIDLQSFRLTTGAPIFVDFKAIPYRDTDVIEWRHRLDEAMSWQQTLGSGRATEALPEMRKRGVTHVVEPADHELHDDKLRLEYRDASYLVYRVLAVIRRELKDRRRGRSGAFLSRLPLRHGVLRRRRDSTRTLSATVPWTPIRQSVSIREFDRKHGGDEGSSEILLYPLSYAPFAKSGGGRTRTDNRWTPTGSRRRRSEEKTPTGIEPHARRVAADVQTIWEQRRNPAEGEGLEPSSPCGERLSGAARQTDIRLPSEASFSEWPRWESNPQTSPGSRPGRFAGLRTRPTERIAEVGFEPTSYGL